MRTYSFLVLAKRRPGLDDCLAFLERLGHDVRAVVGARGEDLPAVCLDWHGDVIISYMSPWIVPEALLARARIASINFHPGPPEYPGTGCTNFALYHGEREYGVTVHHLDPTADTGRIIAVRRFPCRECDSVWDLTHRSYQHLTQLFVEVIGQFVSTGTLPKSSERWGRRPYRRSELEELCRISPDMPKGEVDRRIRATTFPGMPGAYVEIGGHTFEYTGRPRTLSPNR